MCREERKSLLCERFSEHGMFHNILMGRGEKPITCMKFKITFLEENMIRK